MSISNSNIDSRSNPPSIFRSSRIPLKTPIILSFRIKRALSTWRKRAKNSKHRWNILKQWADTERNYIRDLELITTKIQKPMMEKQIITEAQEAILFRNVDTIIKLSKTILQVLEGFIKKENWRPAVIEISQMLLKLHPFLKIYIQYCNHYYKGQNILKTIKNLPEMIQIQKGLPMDIDSYLIKPIQRPPKYMLLLRDYKKHLPQNHPDYKKLCTTIQKYHQINEINNNAIAQQSKVGKMVYLQKLYGQAMQSNRQFIRQFDAYTYKNAVKVYVLTDLLIVTEIMDYKESVYKIIHMDHNSFLHKPQDGKYFVNILFICGKYQTIHLMFDHPRDLNTEYNTLITLLEDILQKQHKRRTIMADKKQQHEIIKVPVTLAQNQSKQIKAESFIKITVDGVEKRPVSKLRSETYYIIKFQVLKPWHFYKLSYTRYSRIEEIFNYLKKNFPQLTIPDLNPDIFNVGLYEQTKNGTQIMQYRCMAIQDFLNRLFRWDKILSNPIFLLQALKMDNNIWQFSTSKKKCECSLCLKQRQSVPTLQNSMSQKRRYFIEKDKMDKSYFCMWAYYFQEFNLLKVNISSFNTIQKIYARLNAYDGKTNESRLYYPPGKEKIQVKIAFIDMTKDNSVLVEVSNYSSVGEVMRRLALKIGIQYFGDFGLFVKYSGVPRLLDEDELICDVLSNIQQQQVQKADDGFFSTIKQGMNRVKKWGQQVIFGKKSRLVIKKYLFLSQQLQSQAYKQDPVRYALILQQAFYNVYCQNIVLNDKQLLTMCAIFICLKSFQKLQHIKRGYFPIDTLRRILPPKKSLLLQTNKWFQDLLKKIDQLKDYMICQPSQSHKLQQYAMEIVQSKISWDAMMVNMTNYQPSTLQESPFNIQVGISHKHLFVVPPKSDKLLLQIPLQVLDYKITPFSLFIELNECKYRFDGKMIYKLRGIIQKYIMFQNKFGHQLNCSKSLLVQSKYISMKSMRF